MNASIILRPVASIRAFRTGSDDVPLYVTPREIAAARAAADFATSTLIGFLWATGARISEALAATPGDLDVQARTVRLPTSKKRRKDGSGTKTSVRRVVPLMGHYLVEVLGLVVENALRPDDAIFPITRGWAWKKISDAMQAAGIDRARAHPHTIRHGHAVHAVMNHVPLNLIQRNLGHSSLLTTAIYLRVTAQDVRAAYEAFDW